MQKLTTKIKTDASDKGIIIAAMFKSFGI